MTDRLQFKHHSQIFDTREQAIDYIYRDVRYATEGLTTKDKSFGYSLFAEPCVVRYKNEEDESNPHVIVAVGANTNDGAIGYGDNRFCIIDIDNTEKEIADIKAEVAAAIVLKAIETNTVKLTNELTDTESRLSADVKLSEGEIFDDYRRRNSIIATDNGLFLHVSMSYDENTDTIKFIVNGDVLNVKLSNSKLASGVYDKKDESIHLFNNDGSEVVIDCEQLIGEWEADEGTSTPVILTREEIGYGNGSGHNHDEAWKDILTADVRLKDEQKVLQDDGTYKYVKDPDSTNILNRTGDGRYLFVDGRASNIIYYDNGVRANVRDALDKVSKNKPSSDDRNIIQSKADGLFASSSLEYVSDENTLVFKTSGQPDTRIKLNSVELFKEVYYDAPTEELVIIYVDADGQVKSERIPLGEMLEKWEWEPQNDGHNVWITKTRIVNGDDKVSADARIYEHEDNILTDVNHSLFVKGTADNIKFGDDSNVKDELERLNWRPSESTDGAIVLTKTRNQENTQDVLFADVIINKTHEDNALVNDHGSLYVGANSIVENSTTFQCLSAETKTIETLLGVEGNCDEEIAYPANEESILSGATTFAEADSILEGKIKELQEEIGGVDIDLVGAETNTVVVNSYLNEEEKRVVEANVKLQGGGDTSAVVNDSNAISVVDGEGLYLSKTWNCGEYGDSESEDVSDDDDSYMNYQRLN